MSSFAVMWAPIVFGSALFLSSGLLFMVQPMIGKSLLPHLGGSPIAWSACLVFFQATLLAGYIHADLLHRCRGVRWQPWVQITLMAFAIVLCFGGVFGDGKLVSLLPRLTSMEDWPIVSTLAVLVVTIGLPYFALAAVGPLLVRWFAHLDHPKASDPYFLFVASNLGGLSALVIYISMIEPHALLSAQWMSWKLAFSALGLLLFLTAFCVWRSPRNPELEPPDPDDPNAPLIPKLIGRGEATWPRRLYWFTTSALPVSLLMGVTDYLTLDLAPVPILWAVPLALYLLAFGQSFGRWAPYEDSAATQRVLLHVFYGLALAVFLFVLTIGLINVRPEAGGGGLEFIYGVLYLLLFFVPFRWIGILQPLCVLLVVFLHTNIFRIGSVGSGSIMLHLVCFYLSVRLCLGMLAKDRPAAQALTTYYAWIGIGGLGGGLFQLLLAPLIFRTAYFEYFFLAALASTLRPAWLTNGFTDWLASLPFAPKQDPKAPTPVPWRGKVALAFDIGLALLVAGVALVLFFMRAEARPHLAGRGASWFWGTVSTLLADFPLVLAACATLILVARPLRFGLALAMIVLLSLIGQDSQRKDSLIARQRTPFGILRVGEEERTFVNRQGLPEGWRDVPERYTERTLMHATTNHGSCITEPESMRRYATAYYHRRGPVGQVMQSMSWFTEPRPAEPLVKGAHPPKVEVDRDYWLRRNRDNARDDARLVASLFGLAAAPMPSPRPFDAVALWSEPPYAVVGLGAGTLYTYAHTGQWVDAYELDPAIIELSEQTPPVFHYFQSAQARGVQGRIFPGDARRSLAKRGREGFYHVIFVDAFNSDAIPTHLVTQQAIEVYLQKLTMEGLICIHTSNRYLELHRVLENMAVSGPLNLAVRVAQAPPGGEDKLPSMSPSTWVMLARNDEAMLKWEKKGGPFVLHAPQNQPRFFARGDQSWTDERASLFVAVNEQTHSWPALIRWMLGLSMFVGALLALVEGITALQSRTSGPPSLAPKK